MKPSRHYVYLQAFQSQRLQRDYAHFADVPQYRKLTDFFLTEMYGPKDFAARDAQARRLHHFIHFAPGLSLRDIEVTLELLDLTVELDKQVADLLVKAQVPIPFGERAYERAYRDADAYQPRVRQIELINESLRRVHRLAKLPLLGTALNNTKTVARITGMGDLHRFLRTGYGALQEVATLEPFLDEVTTVELERLNRIYGVES